MNGRKYYVALGETGSINAINVTTDGAGANSSSGDRDPNQPRIPQRCSVELITCPSCHIVVSILYINIPTCSSDGSCQCDYVWVKEPTVGKSGQEFCGIRSNHTVQKYHSKTKLVSIDFLYSYSYADAFNIEFTAEGNIYTHEGQAEYHHKGSASGYVESPHFPVAYPSDYGVEHTMRNLDSRGFVQLVFTDFQISPWSYVELINSNGSRLDVFNGNTFRPPIVTSDGPVMVLRFRANDEYPDAGFRAKYTFVNYPEKYWFNKPSTDCGGVVEDLGGAITMMNMANPGYTRNFDCIWLLRSETTYAYETHISVRVAQFEEMGQDSSLEIRQGLTSLSFLLESLTGQQSHKTPQGQEYIISASVGFYIRLQGSFSNKSRLAIVYSTFSYETNTEISRPNGLTPRDSSISNENETSGPELKQELEQTRARGVRRRRGKRKVVTGPGAEDGPSGVGPEPAGLQPAGASCRRVPAPKDRGHPVLNSFPGPADFGSGRRATAVGLRARAVRPAA
ncbi:hypothetical protein HPB51_016758 [Rhipicephalus microplus]|uniref:CUB domain-containing protein n=1 Tax=Rhipicephalus microplus TaxID=6941 RepID=A0A9J6DAQ3_RHIMP|nr:hypothetical protein HPB51_016758 [Rhipicephalus microplus]